MAAIVTVKSKCGRITRVRARTTRRYAVVMINYVGKRNHERQSRNTVSSVI
jgi:hypothetical protein